MTTRRTKRSAVRSGAAVLAFVALLVVSWRLRANAPDGRFVDVSDGVLDQVTGLVWQKSDDGTTYTRTNATAHCTSLGGTWRLPTVDELYTILDPRAASPALDPAFTFNSTGGYVYWTATHGTCPPGQGFSIDFSTGVDGEADDTSTYRARCVH